MAFDVTARGPQVMPVGKSDSDLGTAARLQQQQALMLMQALGQLGSGVGRLLGPQGMDTMGLGQMQRDRSFNDFQRQLDARTKAASGLADDAQQRAYEMEDVKSQYDAPYTNAQIEALKAQAAAARARAAGVGDVSTDQDPILLKLIAARTKALEAGNTEDAARLNQMIVARMSAGAGPAAPPVSPQAVAAAAASVADSPTTSTASTPPTFSAPSSGPVTNYEKPDFSPPAFKAVKRFLMGPEPQPDKGAPEDLAYRAGVPGKADVVKNTPSTSKSMTREERQVAVSRVMRTAGPEMNAILDPDASSDNTKSEVAGVYRALAKLILNGASAEDAAQETIKQVIANGEKLLPEAAAQMRRIGYTGTGSFDIEASAPIGAPARSALTPTQAIRAFTVTDEDIRTMAAIIENAYRGK